MGETTLTAKIGRTPVKIDGLVTANVVELMLGMDWLAANKVHWVIGSDVLQINGIHYHLTEKRQDKENWGRRVALSEIVDIPARSETVLPVDIQCQGPGVTRGPHMQWSTPSGMIAPGIVMARTLLPDDSFTAAVRVMNVSDESVVIGKGCTLTNLDSV